MNTTLVANDNQEPLDVVLDAMDGFFQSRVHLTEGQRAACVLWVAHTYVFDHFNVTPRLLLTAPDWGTGKTSAIKTIMGLSCDGCLYEWGISESAIVRMHAARNGELSMGLDQCDNLSRHDSSLLNRLTSGYEVGATTAMSTPAGKDAKDWKPHDFVIGWPMAFAKIGDLPTPQIMSRCLVVRMQPCPVDQRKGYKKANKVLLFTKKDRQPTELALAWRDRIRKALAPHVEALAAFVGETDGDVAARTEDVWEPLIAIAECAGERWKLRAEAGYKELKADNRIVPRPFKRYLACILRGLQHDTRDFFTPEELMLVSGFWPLIDEGTKDQSGKLLGKNGAGLSSETKKIEGRPVRGYYRADILDACRRWGVEPAEVAGRAKAVTAAVTENLLEVA